MRQNFFRTLKFIFAVVIKHSDGKNFYKDMVGKNVKVAVKNAPNADL